MAGGGWGMVGMGGIPTTGAEFSESLSLSPTLSSSESLLGVELFITLNMNSRANSFLRGLVNVRFTQPLGKKYAPQSDSSSFYLLAASSVETSSEGGGGNVVGADGAVGEVGEFPLTARRGGGKGGIWGCGCCLGSTLM